MTDDEFLLATSDSSALTEKGSDGQGNVPIAATTSPTHRASSLSTALFFAGVNVQRDSATSYTCSPVLRSLEGQLRGAYRAFVVRLFQILLPILAAKNI
jgi:hypothetical protein